MTRKDIELIITNWPEIEHTLETMNELARTMDEYRQKRG
jgi:hypothetical protein